VKKLEKNLIDKGRKIINKYKDKGGFLNYIILSLKILDLKNDWENRLKKPWTESDDLISGLEYIEGTIFISLSTKLEKLFKINLQTALKLLKVLDVCIEKYYSFKKSLF